MSIEGAPVAGNPTELPPVQCLRMILQVAQRDSDSIGPQQKAELSRDLDAAEVGTYPSIIPGSILECQVERCEARYAIIPRITSSTVSKVKSLGGADQAPCASQIIE